MRRAFLIGLVASSGLLVGCASTPGSTGAPVAAGKNGADYRLVYEQGFDSLDCLKQFEFSDSGAWTWNAGESALELIGTGAYAPPHRSPASLAILVDLELSDFVLEAELKQTGRNYGHRDMCLFFGYVGPARYYYVHLAPAPDENAHNVFLVDDAPRRNLAAVFEEGLEWQDGVWHHVRLERRGAVMRVYVGGADEPTVAASDATIGAGRVGFGSFDDSGMIRNVKIWAPARTGNGVTATQ
jgi:hypothetical protein